MIKLNLSKAVLLDLELFAFSRKKTASEVAEEAIRDYISESILNPDDRCSRIWKGIVRFANTGKVKLCSQWKDSYDAFKNHVGDPPEAKPYLIHVEDRLGFAPYNVQWVDKETYKSRYKLEGMSVLFRGRTFNLTELAQLLGVPATNYFIKARRRKDIAGLIRKYPGDLSKQEQVQLAMAVNRAYADAGK